MDTAAIERLIAKIGWKYIPATIHTKDDDFVSLLLRPPTSKELGKAALVYSVEYQRGIAIGLPTEKDAIVDMIANKQWNLETDIQIEGLNKDIHNIRRGLLDFLFNKTKLEQARTLLRRAEEALATRLNQKNSLLQNSAEAHAIMCQQRYLIGCITETENGNQFWETNQEFEQFDDIDIILQLCEMFFRQSRVPIELIRQLARSQQWRVYWEIAKETNHLFDCSVLQWSQNQRELAYWSTIYDSVYNAYERPVKDIIIDDDLLDSWFIRQGEKIEGKTKGVPDTKSKRQGRNETFVMADKEGAKCVYDMNDPNSRAKIRARQKILSKQGSIREQDMPDSQSEMRQQLAQMQIKRIKDISRR